MRNLGLLIYLIGQDDRLYDTGVKMGKAAIALIAGWFSVGLATIGWILVHGVQM